MEQEKQIHVADTNHGTILLSNLEKEVISTKLFNRLHHVLQNSTLYLTFPSNKTKRFEHSIGTMKLCGDMFYNAVCNTSEKDLKDMFNKIKKFILEGIVESIILKRDPANSKMYVTFLGKDYFKNNGELLKSFNRLKISSIFYNRYIPNNIKSSKQKIIYLITFQAIRLCGLLHDIGHPPFSHVVEAAMATIYEEIKYKENLTTRENNYLNIFNDLLKKSTKGPLHEVMGNSMVNYLQHDLVFSNNSIFSKICSNEERYFIILVFELVNKIFNDKSLEFLHAIISGSIEGDRLDYVNRDIANSGLDGGKTEYERLLSSCKFVKHKINKGTPAGYVLSFYIKTINTIDDFFNKRWFLYKNIVCHHRVAKTDKLMQNCIEDIIRNYLAVNVNEKKSDNDYLLPDDISGLWRAIEFSYTEEDYFNYLIQWDDNWLLTMLKKYYFKEYYGKKNSTAYKLEELLSNKKNYYSLIKNYDDFCIFNDVFEKEVDISPIENCKDWKEIDKKFSKHSEKILMHKLHAYFETFTQVNFKYIMEKVTKEFIRDKYKNLDSAIFVIKKITTGLSEEPFVYKSGRPYKLSTFSNIKNILELEASYYPYFYIYIKFSEDTNPKTIKDIKDEFLKEFARYTSKEIKDTLSELQKGMVE